MSEFTRSQAYPWALTGIFAAVHLVITLIPMNLSIAGEGSITFGLMSSPIVGYLLGPFFGTIAVIIGSILAIFFNPSVGVLGFFTPIATGAGAFSAGMIRIKKPWIVPLLYIVSMIVFLSSPIGLLAPEYIWFHIVTLVLSLLFIMPKLKEKLGDEVQFSKSMSTRSIWLLSIVSVTLDQAIGGAIGAFYLLAAFSLEPAVLAGLFKLSIFVYPIERLIGSIVVAWLLTSIGESVSSGYFRLPATPFSENKIEELSE